MLQCAEPASSPRPLQFHQNGSAILTLRRKDAKALGDTKREKGTPISSHDQAEISEAFIRYARNGTSRPEKRYPPELIEENALVSAYVSRKTEEYHKISDFSDSARPLLASNFLQKLLVDQKYVTEPITEEQIRAANAWKIAYLLRLRNEKADESYIQAYLKAWNLSEEQVFLAPPGK